MCLTCKAAFAGRSATSNWLIAPFFQASTYVHLTSRAFYNTCRPGRKVRGAKSAVATVTGQSPYSPMWIRSCNAPRASHPIRYMYVFSLTLSQQQELYWVELCDCCEEDNENESGNERVQSLLHRQRSGHIRPALESAAQPASCGNEIALRSYLRAAKATTATNDSSLP